MNDNDRILFALSGLPGFDPEGLLGYRIWADDPDDYGVIAIMVRDSDSDWRVTDESRVDISLADPRTEDALWRWARERMGWPKWSRWYWEGDRADRMQFRVSILAFYPRPWVACPQACEEADVVIPALVNVPSGLHALREVLRWIGQQPEVGHG
jgi:hypothetical protein